MSFMRINSRKTNEQIVKRCYKIARRSHPNYAHAFVDKVVAKSHGEISVRCFYFLHGHLLG